MSAWMPFVSVTQRHLLLRRRQCVWIILILLVFGITTHIYTQSSSGLLNRFALNGIAALTWTKESPKVPRPQDAGTPPPMVQQTFTSFLNKDPTEPPLPIRDFPTEDKLVEKVMPEDSFYFTVLRHPVSLMESAFLFFKVIPSFRYFSTLEHFLDDGQNIISMMDNFAHNSLAFDLGYSNAVTADTPNLETIVNEVIAGIEQDFHLILISEYFDESMILLKHALCWSLEDVVSFKMNSRTDQSRRNISETTPEKVKRWNAIDWRIYEYFNDTFWYKVRNLFGEEEMRREVAQLKELQAKMTSTCLEGGQAVNPKEIKDKTVRPVHGAPVAIQGYNLNPDLDIQTKEKCRRMIIPELQYTRRLFEKQFPEKVV